MDNMRELERLFNKMKPVVLGWTQINDGWIPAGRTWLYGSATTIVITGVDARSEYPAGTLLKLTQTTVKYFRVLSATYPSTYTLLTVTGGGTYSLVNDTITANYLSYAATPQGFPDWFTTGYHPFNPPLTSTSWDGDAHSTTAKTVIDLSTVFAGVPANVKAVDVRLVARDLGSAAATCFFGVSPNNTANSVAVEVYRDKVTNDALDSKEGRCPCDANGDIYFQIAASGAGTLDAWLEIVGYEY